MGRNRNSVGPSGKPLKQIDEDSGATNTENLSQSQQNMRSNVRTSRRSVPQASTSSSTLFAKNTKTKEPLEAKEQLEMTSTASNDPTTEQTVRRGGRRKNTQILISSISTESNNSDDSKSLQDTNVNSNNGNNDDSKQCKDNLLSQHDENTRDLHTDSNSIIIDITDSQDGSKRIIDDGQNFATEANINTESIITISSEENSNLNPTGKVLRSTPTSDRSLSSPEILQIQFNPKATKTYKNKRKPFSNDTATTSTASINTETQTSDQINNQSTNTESQTSEQIKIQSNTEKNNEEKMPIITQPKPPEKIVNKKPAVSFEINPNFIRNTRKKVLKYDVCDLLNKKSHKKIQIEARIDSMPAKSKITNKDQTINKPLISPMKIVPKIKELPTIIRKIPPPELEFSSLSDPTVNLFGSDNSPPKTLIQIQGKITADKRNSNTRISSSSNDANKNEMSSNFGPLLNLNLKNKNLFSRMSSDSVKSVHSSNCGIDETEDTEKNEMIDSINNFHVTGDMHIEKRRGRPSRKNSFDSSKHDPPTIIEQKTTSKSKRIPKNNDETNFVYSDHLLNVARNEKFFIDNSKMKKIDKNESVCFQESIPSIIKEKIDTRDKRRSKKNQNTVIPNDSSLIDNDSNLSKTTPSCIQNLKKDFEIPELKQQNEVVTTLSTDESSNINYPGIQDDSKKIDSKLQPTDTSDNQKDTKEIGSIVEHELNSVQNVLSTETIIDKTELKLDEVKEVLLLKHEEYIPETKKKLISIPKTKKELISDTLVVTKSDKIKRTRLEKPKINTRSKRKLNIASETLTAGNKIKTTDLELSKDIDCPETNQNATQTKIVSDTKNASNIISTSDSDLTNKSTLNQGINESKIKLKMEAENADESRTSMTTKKKETDDKKPKEKVETTEILPNENKIITSIESSTIEPTFAIKAKSPTIQSPAKIKTRSPTIEPTPEIETKSISIEPTLAIKTKSPAIQSPLKIKTKYPTNESSPEIKTKSPTIEPTPEIKTKSATIEPTSEIKTKSATIEPTPEIKTKNSSTESPPEIKTIESKITSPSNVNIIKQTAIVETQSSVLKSSEKDESIITDTTIKSKTNKIDNENKNVPIANLEISTSKHHNKPIDAVEKVLPVIESLTKTTDDFTRKLKDFKIPKANRNTGDTVIEETSSTSNTKHKSRISFSSTSEKLNKNITHKSPSKSKDSSISPTRIKEKSSSNIKTKDLTISPVVKQKYKSDVTTAALQEGVVISQNEDCSKVKDILDNSKIVKDSPKDKEKQIKIDNNSSLINKEKSKVQDTNTEKVKENKNKDDVIILKNIVPEKVEPITTSKEESENLISKLPTTEANTTTQQTIKSCIESKTIKDSNHEKSQNHVPSIPTIIRPKESKTGMDIWLEKFQIESKNKHQSESKKIKTDKNLDSSKKYKSKEDTKYRSESKYKHDTKSKYESSKSESKYKDDSKYKEYSRDDSKSRSDSKNQYKSKKELKYKNDTKYNKNESTSKYESKSKDDLKNKEEIKLKDELKSKDESKLREDSRSKDSSKFKNESKIKNEIPLKDESKSKIESKIKNDIPSKDESKSKIESKSKTESPQNKSVSKYESLKDDSKLKAEVKYKNELSQTKQSEGSSMSLKTIDIFNFAAKDEMVQKSLTQSNKKKSKKLETNYAEKPVPIRYSIERKPSKEEPEKIFSVIDNKSELDNSQILNKDLTKTKETTDKEKQTIDKEKQIIDKEKQPIDKEKQNEINLNTAKTEESLTKIIEIPKRKISDVLCEDGDKSKCKKRIKKIDEPEPVEPSKIINSKEKLSETSPLSQTENLTPIYEATKLTENQENISNKNLTKSYDISNKETSEESKVIVDPKSDATKTIITNTEQKKSPLASTPEFDPLKDIESFLEAAGNLLSRSHSSDDEKDTSSRRCGRNSATGRPLSRFENKDDASKNESNLETDTDNIPNLVNDSKSNNNENNKSDDILNELNKELEHLKSHPIDNKSIIDIEEESSELKENENNNFVTNENKSNIESESSKPITTKEDILDPRYQKLQQKLSEKEKREAWFKHLDSSIDNDLDEEVSNSSASKAFDDNIIIKKPISGPRTPPLPPPISDEEYDNFENTADKNFHSSSFNSDSLYFKKDTYDQIANSIMLSAIKIPDSLASSLHQLKFLSSPKIEHGNSISDLSTSIEDDAEKKLIKVRPEISQKDKELKKLLKTLKKKDNLSSEWKKTYKELKKMKKKSSESQGGTLAVSKSSLKYSPETETKDNELTIDETSNSSYTTQKNKKPNENYLENNNSNIRRSHRIKSIAQLTQQLSIGRGGLARNDYEDLIRPDLAHVQAQNTKFLKTQENSLNQFKEINENEYKCDRIISKEAKKMICDCFLTRDEEERGEYGCGEDCLNRLLMIECGPKCHVNERCTNKRFQRMQYAPCRVCMTEKKGCGIFAEVEIPACEFIMEYVGEVVDSEQFGKRAEEYSKEKHKHFYFMSLRSNSIIDATGRGNISRFINHSCDPNAETQKWTVNGELRIGFFTTRSVAAGEEITFDYQFQRYGKEAQKCYCEAANCRGWIGEEPESDEEIEEEDEREELSELEDATVKLKESIISGEEIKIIDEKEILEKNIEVDIKSLDDTSEFAINKDNIQAIITKNLVKPILSEEEQKRKQQEREQRKQDKQRKREIRLAKQKHDFLEDPDLEDEIYRLSKSGLKNQDQTLRLSRLIVRAKVMQSRLNLLEILNSGEIPCRRLFLDYHGLKLLHGWMNETECNDTSNENNLKMRINLLQTLNCLPIPNKTLLKESKVYQTVQNWSQNKTINTSPTDGSASDSNSSQATLIKEQLVEAEFSNVNENAVLLEIKNLAIQLINDWKVLPEVFRIPRKERVEQMKEHEREADRRYAGSKVVDDENDIQRNQDRYGKSNINSIKSKWSGKTDNIKDRRKEIEKSNDDGMTKQQRRQAFAAKVALDEAEKVNAEKRRSMEYEAMREFEFKCKFFMLDCTKIRPRDLPFCVNQTTNEWFTADKRKISTPPSHMHIKIPAKPQSTNPNDYKLPTLDLPQGWKFAIEPTHGRIYYYHVKIRRPQWEPPPKIFPLTNPVIGSDGVTSGSIISRSEHLNSSSDSSDSENESYDGADAFSLLVQERAISPRKDEDRIYNQIEMRRYKENKEKIRRRKEEIKRRKTRVILNSDEIDDDVDISQINDSNVLPIADYLISSDEDDTLTTACDSKLIEKIVKGESIVDELDALKIKKSLKRPMLIKDRSISSISSSSSVVGKEIVVSSSSNIIISEHKKKPKLDDSKKHKSGDEIKKSKSSKTGSKYHARKAKEKFRSDIAGIIVHHLQPYRKDSCQIGRITSTDDFKHLARKLTHFVMIKELKHCDSTGQILIVTDSVKNKSREFIKKYMAKYGEIYIRPENDPEYKELPH